MDINELKYSFRNKDILLKLIIVLAAIFVVVRLVYLFFFLFGFNEAAYTKGLEYLMCPSNLLSLIKQPWSVFTYMFLHYDFMHVIFNLLVLYWFGKIFAEYIGQRNIVSVFILGGLAGALLYVVAYNIFPGLAFAKENTHLLGASAGVLAILLAIATFVPNYSIHLLFLGPVKLKYIALILFVVYLIAIAGPNAGGNLAHVGGAVFGYFYAIQYKKGNDYALGLNRLLDRIIVMFSGKGPSLKTVYKKPRTEKAYQEQRVSKQERIDSILDKISKSGYESLNDEEKNFLFNESKNNK